MLTNTERQQIVKEVNAGTYGIDEALDDIAAAQKGEEVRKALYAEALVLNREGHAGSTDMIARQQIANLQTSVNGQISTLRTEVGEDIDDLETALNSGLATQNGKIAAQNATIANVVANYNVEYGSTELWASTGETGALAAGTTVTLSEDVSHFDYIDIYSFCGNSNVLDTVPVDAKLQSSAGYALRWVNLSDPDSGSYKAYVRIIETRLHIIGTTLTIDHQVTYRNGEEVNISGAEITQNNRSTYMGELGIMKIVGRKITANTEIEDVRIGADGTEYDSAGQAVRAQVTALESAIPAVDSTLSTQGAAADAKVAGDKVAELKSALNNNPFHVKRFTIVSGTEHSSTKDKIEVKIKAGEKYRIYKSDGTVYAYYSDGTAENVSLSGIASKDIESVGIYKNNTTESDMEIEFYVISNPIGADLYDLVDNVAEVADNVAEVAETTGVKPIALIKNKSIKNNGTTVSMSDGKPSFSDDRLYSAGYTSCSEGDIFTVNGIGGVSAQLYCFVASDGTVLQRSGENKSFTDVIVTAPANSAFFIVQTKDQRNSYAGKAIKIEVTELSERTNELNIDMSALKETITDGYYTQQTETGYAIFNNKAVGAVVDLTPVQSEGLASIVVRNIAEGMEFLIFGDSTYNYLFWSFLDADKKLISKANSWSSSGATGVKVVAPQNAAYLVCSGVANYSNGFSVQYTAATSYVSQKVDELNVDDPTLISTNFSKNATFKFSFFSDAHGGATNVQHIVNHAENNGVQAVINGGDTILRYLDDPNESFDWYADVLSNSGVDILSAVGNHDAWVGAYWTKAPATDVYNAIIKPVVDNFQNIMQPANAEANGLCYYYKDYGDVRVVIINAMAGSTSVSFWDTAQATWFGNVLADAKTNNKHVIVCTHAPYPKTIGQRNEQSQWNSWYDYRTSASSDAIVIETEPLNQIKSFIENGGKFICLLTGHVHADSMLWATNYENMLMVNIASAKYTNHSDGLYYADTNSQYYDCFNYCAVDTTNGILKIVRVGWNMDSSLKKRDTFAYNYFTHQIIKDTL